MACPAAGRTFSRGDFFGHAEILQDKEGSQPVRRAESGRAVLLTLSPAQFYQLVPLHVLVKDSHEQAGAGHSRRPNPNPSPNLNPSPNPNPSPNLIPIRDPTLTLAPALTLTLTQL